jgi:hypothetical protein
MSEQQEQHIFYVATVGNDDWTGQEPEPNATDSDGPFATLIQARDAARAARSGGPCRIVVRGGAYYEQTLALGPEDNGLVVEAAPGETPIFYGGRRITGWRPEGDTFWAADLPSVTYDAENRWDFRMLLVNGHFCPRSRLPRVGAFTHASEFPVRWMSTSYGGWERPPTEEELTTLRYKDDDLGSWLDTHSAELTIYHAWDDSTVGIKSLDPQTRILRFSNPAGHPAGAFANWNAHAQTYVVWNVREGMHAPGQWYLDRTAGKVVYWPMPGEDMQQAEIIAPTVETIIHITGRADAPVRGITLRGLTLQVTNTPLIAADFGAEKLNGAITGVGPMVDIKLVDLTIRNVAGHAIKIRGKGSHHVHVEGCELQTVGAGGIYLTAEDAIITENLISFNGMLYPAAIGIFFGGNRVVVSHNDIHDTSYSGVDVGGGVGHRVEYNDFARVMRVLNDGAAIYAIYAIGAILRGNVARDIGGGPGARHAYYLDEQSQHCVVCDNLAIGVPWPLHNHMSRHNTLRHNFCINDGALKITFMRSHDFGLAENVFYATGPIRFIGFEGATHLAHNIFYSAVGRVEAIRLDDYTETKEITSLESNDRTNAADPLFVDVERGDFRLRPESPAYRLGIAPLDTSQAGRTRRTRP